MTVNVMSDDEKIPRRRSRRCGASQPAGTVWSWLLSCLPHRSACRRWRASVSVWRSEETSLRWGYEHLDAIPQITSHWDPGWRMSITGGASLELSLRRPLSLVTGLRYVQYGNRVK